MEKEVKYCCWIGIKIVRGSQANRIPTASRNIHLMMKIARKGIITSSERAVIMKLRYSKLEDPSKEPISNYTDNP